VSEADAAALFPVNKVVRGALHHAQQLLGHATLPSQGDVLVAPGGSVRAFLAKLRWYTQAIHCVLLVWRRAWRVAPSTAPANRRTAADGRAGSQGLEPLAELRQ
jgi:hypothetical protein